MKLISMDIFVRNFKVHQSLSCVQHEGRILKSFLCTLIPYNSYLFVPHFPPHSCGMCTIIEKCLSSSCLSSFLCICRDGNSLNGIHLTNSKGGSNRIPLRALMSGNCILMHIKLVVMREYEGNSKESLRN